MSILRHMEKTCPETLALAQDWEDVARSVVRTEKKLTEYVHLFLEVDLGLTPNVAQDAEF